MPTAKDIDDLHSAERQLFGGSTVQHEDRLHEDPEYAASRDPRLPSTEDRLAVATIEYDKERRKLITVFFGQLALRNNKGQIDGIATYDKKTGREHFEFPQYLR